LIQFDSNTIRTAPWGNKVSRILSSAIDAVEPGNALLRHVQRHGNQLSVEGQNYDLLSFRRIFVIGGGKAGAPMARKMANILKDRLTEGVIVVKEGYSGTDIFQIPDSLIILEARHPIPDYRSVVGARRIADLLADTKEDDLVICLISGGGSALLVSPVPGLNLEDLQELTSLLLSCGASINEINTLRKHLEQHKGGGLARLVHPAKLVTLILSDVVGSPLDVIASGLTVPDTTTFEDAYQILQRYGLMEKVSPVVVSYLQQGLRGDIDENPKPGNPLFNEVLNVIIGDNLQAAQAAQHQAQAEGFNTLLLTTSLQGEARQAGRFLASIARQVAETGQPIPRPACVVIGGETSVTLSGNGLGGRNQELALGSVEDLAEIPEVALVTLATDGGDGPTDAAGAIVTGDTLKRAKSIGLDPAEFLACNDSYNFFQPLGDLLKPGPTLTNVNDLTFVYVF